MQTFFDDLQVIVVGLGVIRLLLEKELGIAEDDAQGIVDLMGDPCGCSGFSGSCSSSA